MPNPFPKTVVKYNSLAMQTIQVGRFHKIIAGSMNRIEALLIGNDEYDVWSLICH